MKTRLPYEHLDLDKHWQEDWKNTHLSSFALYSIHDGLESRIGKPRLLSSLLVILKSRAHSLWSIIKCITERLVDRLKAVTPSHEHLQED